MSMKKLLSLLTCGLLLLGCSDKYDDSALRNDLNDLKNRVTKLEELCKQMNTNISSLQEIVKALKERESITNVSTLSDGSGYSITFTSGKTITIYHGKNGSDGSDGTNGVTPTISVKQDTDGIYYWTVNGNWLIVDGKKVKAIGTDGADGSNGNDGTDGTNGKDGITPKFKIDGGYWYISYDNEQSWEQLGKATGDSGLNGEDGDAFFKGVSIADGFVIFTLNDKESTEIKIPFYSETELTVHVTEPGTLKSLLTDEQMRTVLALKVIGNINDEDIQTIDASMLVVERVDLSDTDITGSGSFSGAGLLYGKQTLKEIIYPESCTNIEANAFYGCRNLKTVIAPGVRVIGSKAFYNCYNLTDLTMSSLMYSASAVFKDSFSGCNSLNISIYDPSGVIPVTIAGDVSYGSGRYTSIPMKTLYIPANIREIEIRTFGGCDMDEILFASNSILEKISSNPNGLTSYIGGAFGSCKNIKRVDIPESVIIIGEKAFSYCTNLETVSFGQNSKLQTIGDGAFAGCTSLKEIEIPASITVLYLSAFSECDNLKTIICHATLPPRLNNASATVPENCVLYVPNEAISLYREATNWNRFKTILPIPE
jgi:hypothetical protein